MALTHLLSLTLFRAKLLERGAYTSASQTKWGGDSFFSFQSLAGWREVLLYMPSTQVIPHATLHVRSTILEVVYTHSLITQWILQQHLNFCICLIAVQIQVAGLHTSWIGLSELTVPLHLGNSLKCSIFFIIPLKLLLSSSLMTSILLVILPDLSAAFDTADPSFFLDTPFWDPGYHSHPRFPFYLTAFFLLPLLTSL